jgi:hypothetical protein
MDIFAFLIALFTSGQPAECGKSNAVPCVERLGGGERPSRPAARAHRAKSSPATTPDDGNNGHGNDPDGDDDSNPGRGR